MKLSIAQKFKIKLIKPFITKKNRIIDLGCGNMWLTNYFKKRGYKIKGFSLEPPADILGDVKKYKFKRNFYDVVIALEMVEHVDCFKEIKSMLKPNGLLIITTPVPHLDWFCLIMEKLGVFQSRGNTPHINLLYIDKVPLFKKIVTKTFFFMQFGVFKK
jgi:2-polyprenyl-3-methyl-5-hydroxy-6-metoxy-1,4-benzoquinol methylase